MLPSRRLTLEKPEAASAPKIADPRLQFMAPLVAGAPLSTRELLRAFAKFMETDIAFHRILFRTTKNPVFEAVHGALVNWLMERWRSIDRNRSTETMAYHGHLQIYKAIRRGDCNAAEKAMYRHLAASWRVWARHLDRTDNSPS